MQAIIAILVSVASTKAGQTVLMWLFSLVWKYASSEVKDKISQDQIQRHIKDVLAEYEKVIEDARLKGLDGYTEIEKEEIRKKKTELEERLMNETKA